jgi:hypothetical protein
MGCIESPFIQPLAGRRALCVMTQFLLNMMQLYPEYVDLTLCDCLHSSPLSGGVNITPVLWSDCHGLPRKCSYNMVMTMS